MGLILSIANSYTIIQLLNTKIFQNEIIYKYLLKSNTTLWQLFWLDLVSWANLTFALSPGIALGCVVVVVVVGDGW